MITIDSSLCTGCKQCAKKCMFGAIQINNKLAVINESCVWCGACASACPFGAISMPASTVAQEELDRYRDIWVIMQVDAGQPKKVSYELVSEARRLADDLGQKVVAVCLCGEEPANMDKHLAQVGCDELLLIEHEALAQYNTDIFTDIVCGLILKENPNIVLFPATENGRDLAPRVSGRIQVGLTADCTGLDLDQEKRLVQIRPTYGGNIMASIISPSCRPQMASIRPNVFSIQPAAQKSSLAVRKIEVQISGENRVKRVGFKEKEVVYKDVGEANVILAGGYGLGKDGLQLLNRLAIKIGAAVGVTRKVVDEGWAPFEIQIGQTGKTVAPDVYVAFGISGALQHSISIQQSKKIIAINNDPIAPIFMQSDVSIFGDAKQILENLIQKVERNKDRDVLADMV